MKKNYSNVPVHSPLFPDPFVPYQCKGYVSMYAVLEVNKKEIEQTLSYTPFDYVDNKIVVSISDFSNTDKLSYMDCAIVVPVQYKGKTGGYYIYEYENQDAAIAAGRDLWGYPKKYAAITLKESNGAFYGEAVKDGQAIIKLSGDFNHTVGSLAEPITTPHLNIRTIPKPTGGIQFQEIIERDTSPDFVLYEKRYTNDIQLTLQSSKTDLLNRLEPLQILGGGLIKGDFYATEENGWGKVLDTIIY
ncbi:acetoacetate decarboxylase family protein [Oceanobacillus sp. CFH 90083]|uniref:acetoacetate decarboxylase family protein n=1 Tax=Oceanobacillus sp. CFH 90083 TaxID=2592336 RepID=UPI00128B99A8|nr:acetoacetate decarboxylase family protein [Oceanobacillus sp. CFH 90083]